MPWDASGSWGAAICTPRALPPGAWMAAARLAVRANPVNRPGVGTAQQMAAGLFVPPEHLAVLTTKYWPAGTVIPVAFLDAPPADLRDRILGHATAWAATANVAFVPAGPADAWVRVARFPGGGYWSLLGTDHRLAATGRVEVGTPAGETLNLDSFTMRTPDSEFHRVVRHEFGHALGFPHEHSRGEIIALLDPDRVVAYFQETQGWSEAMIRQQILTPLDPAQLLAAPAEQASIMCYQFPGSVTRSGRPIPGGADITAEDAEFAARVYPGRVASPPPS